MPARFTPWSTSSVIRLQALEVVVAVAASAAIGARRGEQSPALIEPQRLRPYAGQLRGHRDAVDTAR